MTVWLGSFAGDGAVCPQLRTASRSFGRFSDSLDEMYADAWLTAQLGHIARCPPAGHPLAAEAVKQGVVRRWHAGVAVGEASVRTQLRNGRWQSPAPGIVVLHNGPLTADQRLWIALTASPPGSVVGGLAAAGYDGLTGLRPDHLTIVVPGRSQGVPRHAASLPAEWNIAWRWSNKLGPEDVNTGAIPPRTRLARSLLDAASERVSPRRSRVIILAGIQQRLLRTEMLWDALSRRGKCRNRRIIVESILDAEGGIQSLPEHEFDLIRRRLRLPAPARQRVLRRPDGRYYLDIEWSEYRIRVEIHGIPHSYVQNWDNDLLRQNDITIQGGGLLIVSSYAIRHIAQVVDRQLLAMFQSRGWTG